MIKREESSTQLYFSTFAIIFYGLINVVIKLLNNLGPDKFWKTPGDMVSDPSFAFLIRTAFEKTVKLHPTYASIFLGITILLLLDQLLRKFQSLNWNQKFLFYSSISIALLLQGILASRTPFMATMLGAFLLFFFHLKKKIYGLYVIAGMALITLTLAVFVPSFSSRFKEISITNTQLPTGSHENSFNIRTGIYKCSMELISDHWFWGVGPGNVQAMLNTCYNEISKVVYENKNYNTHNQFLDYWAGLGFLGPLSLILILLYNSYKNVKIKNYIVPALSVLFLIGLFTENLLTRQNGIVPFAYFISCYFFSSSPQSSRK
ncbi:MAG: O-antigen ligase family protein [Bacteroidetes bacterium]|nr:O-antigen ligase family protein [Bacteroidota bacterium]